MSKDVSKDVRAELKDWATKARVADDPAVATLDELLRTGNPDAVDIDVMSVLPLPRRRDWVLMLLLSLRIVRTSLIFLPLILTWRAIGAVTRLAVDERADSLLDVWVTGAGLRYGETLPGLASHYVLILVGVLVATVLIGIVQWFDERQRPDESAHARLAMRITAAFREAHRKTSMEERAAQLSGLADRHQALLDGLDATISSLEKDLPAALEEVVESLRVGVSEKLAETVASFHEIAVATAGARSNVDGIGEELAAALSTVDTAVAQHAEQIAAHLGRLAAASRDASELSSAIRSHVAEGIDVAVAGFEQRVAGVGSALSKAADDLTSTASRLDKTMMTLVSHAFATVNGETDAAMNGAA